MVSCRFRLTLYAHTAYVLTATIIPVNRHIYIPKDEAGSLEPGYYHITFLGDDGKPVIAQVVKLRPGSSSGFGGLSGTLSVFTVRRLEGVRRAKVEVRRCPIMVVEECGEGTRNLHLLSRYHDYIKASITLCTDQGILRRQGSRWRWYRRVEEDMEYKKHVEEMLRRLSLGILYQSP